MATDGSNVKPQVVKFDPANRDFYKYAVESRFNQMGCLDIINGGRTLSEFDSDANEGSDDDVEEENAFLRLGRKEFLKQQNMGFAYFIDTLDGKMEYINLFKNKCEIGELQKAWNSFWEEMDSKKTGAQAVLWNDLFCCKQSSSENASLFLDRVHNISAKIVEPPPQHVLKGVVARGIGKDYYAFVHTEALKGDLTWDQFRESVKDHTSQGDAFSRLRDGSTEKEKDDSVASEDTVNLVIERLKKRKLSDITCFKCNKKGHYKRECPELQEQEKEEKKKKKKKKRDWTKRVVLKDDDESDDSSDSE
jgi:hypothetical protein